VRIALVRQRYDPFGGAERFIERALPALERAGAEVTLIARRWDSNSRHGNGRDGGRARGGGNETRGALKLLRVDPFHAGNLWRDCSFARAARAAWRGGGFDLVQSHERIPGCDIYRAGDGVHRRWLELRRAAAGPLERLGMALNPYHRYVCAAERRMFEHPRLRAVICNSAMVRDEIASRFRIAPEKLHLIHNGVDLQHFHPQRRAALRRAARAEWGVAEHETVFVFVGSGYARKGLDAAIAALAQCAGARFRLLVAGRDRDTARYAAQARDVGVGERVHFAGGRDDVQPLYAAADCFILPTRYDPFPNSALEALAMGLPVIVGRRSGAAELVRAGENGWVCDPEDVAGVARLMQQAAAAGGSMDAAARATAERYGLDEMAGKLTRLYSALGATAAA
jgi:UDP-glucose:(heptosyl)LPS alpha-1,3-glucosyltransferase